MTDSGITWLPQLHLLSDYSGDWDSYFEAAYKYFVKDFIKCKPMLLGKDVESKRQVAYQGKDHSFWHCIEESIQGKEKSEDNRVPKISLCERIRWPRPIIEHAIISNDVLAWTEVYHGRGSKSRVHLYVEDEDYVVVLDPRGRDENGQPRYYYLWTTFLCETERQRQAMLKRYFKGKKLGQ